MNALNKLTEQFRKLGYASNALVRDYHYPDVLSSGLPERTVPLAAFTDTPTSYRNAAFGVLVDCNNSEMCIQAHRALGAPIWLCISDTDVEVWNVFSPNGAVREAVRPVAELNNLFEEKQSAWTPDRFHNAKRGGYLGEPSQLNLLDWSLFRDIESNTREQLERVITKTLQTLATAADALKADYRRAYRACFYFLAAKIVLDRQHPVGQSWGADDAESILNSVTAHYGLSYAAEPAKGLKRSRLDEAWRALRDDVSFANVSVDDLAFVYENTLISPETRKVLGTHSTPRAVAEFLVSRLRLEEYGRDVPQIYEPFCGAGVLSVAALSSLRRNLPCEWTDAQRHAFLVRKISGADIDPFACEVASLSLVLADYPSRNGWDIRSVDLFKQNTLTEYIKPGSIILCNPPFEDFTPEERTRHKHDGTTSVHKPIYVLDSVLATKPIAIGFVLPHGVIADSQYTSLRQRLERNFSQIELISLPDRVFVEADFESALLVAREPRHEPAPSLLTVRSATVTDEARNAFLEGAERPEFRVRNFVSDPHVPNGDLWVPELAELWDYLRTNPTLGSLVELHRGIEWVSGHQRYATSRTAKRGYRRGVHSSKDLYQFYHHSPVYLDCRPEYLRGGAIDLPWNRPKVVINAIRKSRGAWRLAASLDNDALVLSQQFIGAWANDDKLLPQIEAILNSPIASAFIGIHNQRKGLRVEVLERLPIPVAVTPDSWTEAVSRVHALASPPEILSMNDDRELSSALLALDAAILKEYALPARLERDLLMYFEGARRPLVGAFSGYPHSRGGMALSLEERLAGKFSDTSGDWIKDVFRTLPADERDLVAAFLP